jgi:hypothetical protein
VGAEPQRPHGLKAEKNPLDWPYGKTSHPVRGDVISVIVNGRRELATVTFWNRNGIWLRARKDSVFLWLSLREIEFNYARKWR